MRRIVLCLSTTLVACIAWASPAMAGHVNCGDVLTQDTTLDSDLVCPGDALRIGADGVTLNLAGYEIRGPGVNSGAVAVDNLSSTPAEPGGFNDMTVTNGRITDYSGGVRVQDSTGGLISNLTLQGYVQLRGADGYVVRRNVFLKRSILLVDADSNLIQGNHVEEGRIQIIMGWENVIDRNKTLGIMVNADHTVVSRNAVRSIPEISGIAINNSTGNVVERNHISGARVGIYLSSQRQATVSRNRVTDSVEDGIRVAFSQNTLLEENFSRRNGDDGIDVDSLPTTVTGNVANGNGDLGIEAAPGTTDGGGNSARRNGNPAQCTGVSCS